MNPLLLMVIAMVGVVLAGTSAQWAARADGWWPGEGGEAPPVNLKLKIEGPTKIESAAKPTSFTVTVSNTGAEKLAGAVAFEAVDGFAIDGDAERPFELPPGGEKAFEVAIRQDGQLHQAFYSLHARAWTSAKKPAEPVHEIAVFELTDESVKPAWTEKPPKIAPAGQAPQAGESAAARRTRAIAAARAALQIAGGDKQPAWSWRLSSEAGDFGAAIVSGPAGLVDAAIALADADGAIVFDGFDMQVSQTALDGDYRAKASFQDGRGTIDWSILVDGKPATCRAEIWAESGALRVSFSMPGVERDKQGHPRYTSLAVGAFDRRAKRVYAGMGNVVEDPLKFDLRGAGIHLCTSHVGVEFADGLALLTACDVFPDVFSVDADKRQYSLQTRHDATFTLLGSSKGAFAAARAYRAVAGFETPGGVKGLLGRMCLDQWRGDYGEAAKAIERAARYGLTDSVFVKHVWQRWGYDYRLPEIYPPSGSIPDFNKMAAACRETGILFCPHDNYVDFYPDAKGYDYKHIIFNPDGTPQKAWFNRGRNMQSYRWLPTAFGPWMEENLKLVRDGIAPGAYFTDVFSAIPPMDFFDEAGNFSPKTVTIREWAAALDRMREVLGCPTISEDAVDAFMGHLDGAESDHGPATQSDNYFAWGAKGADSVRVPWHDMVSHGTLVLFAGGLSDRYVADDPTGMGYGSDDYLSNTVIGGRGPMCDGPFSRRAVMTYWLLHDVCAELARRDMLAHEFAGDDIHRQHVTFGDGGSAWTNRGETDWTVEGVTLPWNGLLARAGDCEAAVAMIDGARVAWAKSPGVWFFDTRPPLPDGVGPIEGWQVRTNRREKGDPAPETLLKQTFIDFGPVATDGAFRVLRGDKQLRIIPLPDGPSFRVVIRPDKFAAPAGKPTLRAMDEAGKESPAPELKTRDGELEFQADAKTFEYRLVWE